MKIELSSEQIDEIYYARIDEIIEMVRLGEIDFEDDDPGEYLSALELVKTL